MSNAMKYLTKTMNGNVLVSLKNGSWVRGILRAFDNHLNLIVDNAEEMYHVQTSEGTEVRTIRLGKRVLIRGDTVVAISTPGGIGGE
ncbi:MAG TPA: RNA-binding protein [Candidatus Korarchaeota archaeon]|nr:RNA-binding protein [Candidatus Korarchaeota archaeon]